MTAITSSPSRPRGAGGPHRVKQTTTVPAQQHAANILPGQSLLKQHHSVVGKQIQHQPQAKGVLPQQRKAISILRKSHVANPFPPSQTSGSQTPEIQTIAAESRSVLKADVTKPTQPIPTSTEAPYSEAAPSSSQSGEAEQEIVSPGHEISASTTGTPTNRR